jgi:hypothetical protein
MEGKPDPVHTTEFTVIAKDVPVSFDFLLGRGWCAETKALRKNPEVLCLDVTQVARTNTWAETDLNLVSIPSLLRNHDSEMIECFMITAYERHCLHLEGWPWTLGVCFERNSWRRKFFNWEKQSGYNRSYVWFRIQY